MTDMKTEMSNDCQCDNSLNQKNKWTKVLYFGKKKKKKKMEAPLHHEDILSCPICAQNTKNGPNRCMIDAYDEKQRLKAEVVRADPNAIFEEADEPRKPQCGCMKCRRERGEDPLTVELLPMETQLTLANTLQDTVLMCAIL